MSRGFALALILALISYLGRDLNPHGRESKGFSYQLRLLTLRLQRICGLDFTFSVAFALGVFRQVSTPSFDVTKAWLGITILKVSPTLKDSTLSVSAEALKLN